MFGFFTPRHVKDGHELLKGIKRLLAYQRDLLRPEDVSAVEGGIGRLTDAVHSKSREQIDAVTREIEEIVTRIFPAQTNQAIRENCEVFLVAIVIAIGVRTFFLQPFTIPTGSMQPTLNGILAHVTDKPAPNILIRTLHMALFGRSYVDIVSKEEDTIVSVRERPWLRFFTVTDVDCVHQHFTAFSPADKMHMDFRVFPGRAIGKDEVVARGYVDTGDHIFVDKASYNFRMPRHADVFVFSTAHILTQDKQMNPDAPSQFYIKRLGGQPNDVLRIDPPNLEINGQRAKGFAFERVMAAKDGYHGYSNAPRMGPPFQFLGSPEASFHVPEHDYFALGDNSLNSSDSRAWGVVPEENIVGRGCFVYWPFTSHWGFVK